LSLLFSQNGLEVWASRASFLDVFGLTLVTYLSSGSMTKALMMAAFGLLLGCIGTDLVTTLPRYTLGILELLDGLGLVPVVMGLFGISEVLLNIEKSYKKSDVFKTRVRDLFPTKQDWKDSAGPLARGSLIGFFLGIIPGAGNIIASFISYAVEKRISKHPETFGTGDIRGVAAPETANNAGVGGTFIPLLTMGIPCNAATAIFLGALIIHGVMPGPMMMKNHPELFWGVVGSMYIGNVMLLVLNLPLISLWVRILKVPYPLLFPLIFLFCLIGAYSINNSVVDVFIMIIFGTIGYLMQKFHYSAAPLILAFVLGPLFEENLSQSLVISHGNPMIFLSRPISAAFAIVSFIFLLSPLLSRLWKKRHPVFAMKGNEKFDE
jgi:putative tricarboxylic transport membrane protein